MCIDILCIKPKSHWCLYVFSMRCILKLCMSILRNVSYRHLCYYFSHLTKESIHLLFLSGRMEGHVIHSHIKKKLAIHVLKTLYGWWLLEEGTSRNVPIAGFEMILREDYKSRDEVEGLIFFPKYHFKPQDTGNIPWCSRQQSRHLLYCMATHCPHCIARLRHSSQKFTKLSIFFSGDFL